MFLRVVAIVALFGADKLTRVAAPLIVAAMVLLAASIAFGARWEPAEKGDPDHVFRNPFELFAVLRFAALLAVILVASKWLVALFGGAGAVVFAGVAGLADVDAITLSMTQAGGGGISASEAALAIFVATVANSLSKSAIGAVAGGTGFGLRYAAVTAAALLAGGAAMLVQSWLW